MQRVNKSAMTQAVAQRTEAKASNGGYTFADAEAMKISARNPFPTSRDFNFSITVSNALTSGTGVVPLINNPISVLDFGTIRSTDVTYDAGPASSKLDVSSSFPGGIAGLKGWLAAGYQIDINRILYTADVATQFSETFEVAKLVGIEEGTVKKNISAKVGSAAGPQVFQSLRLEIPVSLQLSSVTDLLVSFVNPASGTNTTIFNFFGKYAGQPSTL